MIHIKSSLSGQKLMSIGFLDGEAYLNPAEVRELLRLLKSSPIARSIGIRFGASMEFTTANKVLGGQVACDVLELTKKEEDHGK